MSYPARPKSESTIVFGWIVGVLGWLFLGWACLHLFGVIPHAEKIDEYGRVLPDDFDPLPGALVRTAFGLVLIWLSSRIRRPL